jgi:ABC-type sugar transport system ATPase subunit/ribose/xylose/arabinose/galactoside ABC-type transport system permease subunit
MNETLCDLRGVDKSFGDNRVLKQLNLSLPAGSVTVLMGANGAGKSTLVKILSGVHGLDAGSITLLGTDFRPSTPSEAIRAGVVTVHQNINDGVIPDLDVASNLLIDRLAEPGYGFFLKRRQNYADAERIASQMGLSLNVRQSVAELGVADRQLIAIARAMAHDPRLLILDEPTSSLSASEAERLFLLIERLSAKGVAVLYISHRMSDIRRIADRIVSMRDGEISGVFEGEELDYEGAVNAMLGHRMTDADITIGTPGKKVLEITDLRLLSASKPFDLNLCENEVVAITGLLGSGKSAFAQSLFGLGRPAGGQIRIDGEDYAPENPKAAIARGVFMSAKDRANNAVVADFDITRNITLPFLARYSNLSFIQALGRAQHRQRDDRGAVDRLSGRDRFDRHAVGRQPAEGDAGALAGRGLPAAAARRAFPGCRHSRPPRYRPQDPRNSQEPGDPGVRLGTRRGAGSRRPHHRHDRALGRGGVQKRERGSQRDPDSSNRGHAGRFRQRRKDSTRMSMNQTETSSAGSRAPKPQPGSNGLIDIAIRYGFLALLVGLVIFFSVFANGFAGPRSAVFIFQSVAITGILALGVTCTLVVGGFDLSIGSVATSSMMLAAYMMVVLEQPAFVAIIACLAMGAFIGLINGLLIVKTKVPDLLATLGMMFLLVGLQRIPTEGRSIAMGMTLPDGSTAEGTFSPLFLQLGRHRFDFMLENLLPAPVIFLVVIGILVWVFLELTRHGRLMYAIGSNERAASLTGTNVNNYKILAYMISGVLASIGGMLLAARLGRGDIASGTNLLLDAVAAALIGFAVLGAAKPNAFGTAMGALFVGILLQGLTMMNAPYYTQDFIKGLVLVIALVFTFSLSARKAGGH